MAIIRRPSQVKEQLAKFTVGTKVNNKYEIDALLGKGGYGFVCRAKDLSTPGKFVALKFLYADYVHDEKLFARFKRELTLAQELNHPNIIRAYELGEAEDAMRYISMEYLEGESLSSKLKSTPNGIPVTELTPYLYQVAQGLHYAHERGIIHRDIKPANILIGKDGTAKIADYGIGRPIISEEKLTKTREVLGSAAYMSPEQCKGLKVDHSSDIYSFGIMAYELAVGKPPFDHPDAIVVLVAHETTPIPDCASKEKGIPIWYSRLIEKACAKDPKHRFQTMNELAEFIDKHGTRGETCSVSSNMLYYILTILAVIALATAMYLFE